MEEVVVDVDQQEEEEEEEEEEVNYTEMRVAHIHLFTWQSGALRFSFVCLSHFSAFSGLKSTHTRTLNQPQLGFINQFFHHYYLGPTNDGRLLLTMALLISSLPLQWP